MWVGLHKAHIYKTTSDSIWMESASCVNLWNCQLRPNSDGRCQCKQHTCRLPDLLLSPLEYAYDNQHITHTL